MESSPAPQLSPRDRLERMVTIVRRSTRFWKRAAVVFGVGCAIALTVAITRPRTYKSETLILYREGIRSSELGGVDQGGDPARKLGMRLKEMVLSRTQLKKLIQEFKLYPKIVEDRNEDEAVDEMRKHVAFRVQDGDSFGLSFEGDNPDRVQEVTAKLAEILVTENSKTESEQATVTKEFLDTEKKRIVEELKLRETALAKFLAQHPEFAKDTAQATNPAGTAIRTAALKTKVGDPELQALERSAARIQARLGMPTKSTGRRQPTSDPRLIAARQEAEQDLATAQRDLAEKLGQFTEQHPDVRSAKLRVKNATDRLKRANEAVSAYDLEAAKKIAETPDVEEGTIDRAALENELKRVNEDIAAYKRKRASGESPVLSKAAEIVALETEWTRINREVAEARERTRQLEDKQFKASMAASSASLGRNAHMTILDPAYRPMKPSKGGRTVVAGIGGGVALVLAIAAALLAAFFDDRLYDRYDLERVGGLKFLGGVPRAPKRKRGALHG